MHMIFSLIGAYVLVDYLRVNTTCVIVFPVALALQFLYKYKIQNKEEFDKNKKWIFLLSLVFSGTIVLCKHMVINFESFYSDITTNYIMEFKCKDVIALCILCYESMLVSFGIIKILLSNRLKKIFCDKEKVYETRMTGISSSKEMFILAGIILICWIPYFIKYFPGILYGDSKQSLFQIVGDIEYNNHHPIMYTLFIKGCLYIGRLIGGNTNGVALYSILQMLLMSIIFGYSVCWLRNKNISKFICCIVLLFYALPRFWGQHAISMWKDPAFSVLVLFFSLKLFDIIYSRGRVVGEKGFKIQVVLCVLGISFLRNNGIYVAAFSIFVLMICLIEKGNRRLVDRKFLLSMVVLLIAIYLIQGPGYNKIGLYTDPVESYGVPLQQVARTVVYNGKISREERAFLNELMPLDKYAENYSPGLVDHLKWSEDFNTAFFNEHQNEFKRVWLELFKKNPKLYFEAWALNTAGFWGINYWELNGYIQNVAMGVPLGEELNDLFQIKVRNNQSEENTYFSLTTPMPSIALTLWIMLGMLVVAFVKKVPRHIIIFAPCIGNIITLMVASPITYWPRYGLSLICLLPICIVFPFIMEFSKCNESGKKNG